MHNLALALHAKTYNVTGSDDEIFDPAKSRLEKIGILPEKWGWFPSKINTKLDAVILGMHARQDNPELQKARELNIPIYSFPEFMYEQTKDKLRVAIAGSHGKTTVTAMIMHVLRNQKIKFDYLVGAQLEGFETMVGLSNEAKIAIFEGDEYLSSPLDLRPKFYHYKPQVLVLNGIAWDHINVFPTKQSYLDAFSIYLKQMNANDVLIYNEMDVLVKVLVQEATCKTKISFKPVVANVNKEFSVVNIADKPYKLKVFGQHNLSNLSAALAVCKQLEIGESEFFDAMQSFSGAARRLQLIKEREDKRFYFDFAHSPSKLAATVKAVKEQFNDKKLLAIMELHTFSSLNSEFLQEYKNTMELADFAYVYYSEEVLKHKKLASIAPEFVKNAFASENIQVFTDSNLLYNAFVDKLENVDNVLIMSSGNLGGLKVQDLADLFIE